MNKLNWISSCSDTSVSIKSWELYTCLWWVTWGHWHWFYKEKDKKISVKIDYWNNIKETNENNNVWTTIINITD